MKLKIDSERENGLLRKWITEEKHIKQWKIAGIVEKTDIWYQIYRIFNSKRIILLTHYKCRRSIERRLTDLPSPRTCTQKTIASTAFTRIDSLCFFLFLNMAHRKKIISNEDIIGKTKIYFVCIMLHIMDDPDGRRFQRLDRTEATLSFEREKKVFQINYTTTTI